MLTIQAHQPGLKPGRNRTPNHYQTAVLYIGLYGTAIGVGGIKAALPAHGADQLDHASQRAISSFFNWFFFSICAGGLITYTVMVWVVENLGWSWSFGISLVALGSALLVFIGGFPIYRYRLPGGSPLARIYKVTVSMSFPVVLLS